MPFRDSFGKVRAGRYHGPAPTLSPNVSTAADELLLKVMPPRAPRHLVVRQRWLAHGEALRDTPILLVEAPPGFGKTALLAQWRREHLSHGRAVAWLSAQSRDEPVRLVQALALAVRIGAGRPTFGHTLLEGVDGRHDPDGLAAMTVWLAEVAQTALDLVLLIDEADRLPPAGRQALAYLLRNLPANLRCIVAARPDGAVEIDDLIHYGLCVRLGASALRLRLEETIELVRLQGGGLDADTTAWLHEQTEGWPLGLQLALSVRATGADLRGGGAPLLREALVGQLLDQLDPADTEFLTRVALLDPLHPALCRALLPEAGAEERLARLARDTPMFLLDEHGDWLRMHRLARGALRERFAALPVAVQTTLHTRAATWLAAHGQPEAAARHAYACGDAALACELAERSLYESFMAFGRQSAVLEWLARLPAEEVERRPRLLLAAAWSLALSERHDEAGRLVERLLGLPGGEDAALRCECALILGGAAVFADEPDRFAALHDPWAEHPPLHDPLLLQVHANRTAFRTLLDGDPALARLRQQQAPRQGHAGPALGYVNRWGELVTALTYLWEGQVLLAEQLLRPTLAHAEGQLGRRSLFACMLATLLASACWERDRADEATALLANRLDVIERSALPEIVLLAYRTLARVALAGGAEHRALELLQALHAVGVARRLPRLCVASLSEQVRLHARQGRAETCTALCHDLDTVCTAAQRTPPHGPLWWRSTSLLRELALGQAALARQDWRGALAAFTAADAVACAVRLGRQHIELLGLRAWVLARCGEPADALLHEAIGLADAHGLRRVFADAHPALGDWVRAQIPGPPAAPAPTAPTLLRTTVLVNGTALTPKEREVLTLLARHLSNKEIGRALQVGEETVKWHLKNLFAKLDAGTRQQVVQRARLLGLLEPLPG